MLFIRRLDDIHTLREKAANAFGTPIENPIFKRNQQRDRWGKFKNMDPQARRGLPLHDEGGSAAGECADLRLNTPVATDHHQGGGVC